MPLIRQLAESPNASGVLAEGLLNKLTEFRSKPMAREVQFIDMNAIDDVLRDS